MEEKELLNENPIEDENIINKFIYLFENNNYLFYSSSCTNRIKTFQIPDEIIMENNDDHFNNNSNDRYNNVFILNKIKKIEEEFCFEIKIQSLSTDMKEMNSFKIGFLNLNKVNIKEISNNLDITESKDIKYNYKSYSDVSQEHFDKLCQKYNKFKKNVVCSINLNDFKFEQNDIIGIVKLSIQGNLSINIFINGELRFPYMPNKIGEEIDSLVLFIELGENYNILIKDKKNDNNNNSSFELMEYYVKYNNCPPLNELSDKKNPLIDLIESNIQIEDLINYFKNQLTKKKNDKKDKKENENNTLLIEKGPIEKLISNRIEKEDNYYKEYYENCNLYFCKFPCHCCLCCLKSNYKNSIKQIEEDENDFNSYDNFLKKNKKRKLKIELAYLFFFLFIFFHYIAIAQINSVMYSLFGEAKRSFFISFNFTDHLTNKSFEELIKNSNIKDTSQINLFYFTSIFTSHLLKIFNKYVLYIISFLINSIILLRMCFIDYLSCKQTENYEPYKFEDYILNVIAPLASLYIFTGFIASIPFYLVETFKELSGISPWSINLLIISAVIIKIILCKIPIYEYNLYELFLYYIISIILSIIFFTIFHCCKKEIFAQKEEEISINYNFGKLEISSDLVEISIRTKTFCNYLCSFFNRKLVFLLIVNLCSRASKLKFKTDYKHYFQNDDDDDPSALFIIVNFCGSFVIFLITIGFRNHLNCEICNSNEKAFSFFILIENIIMCIFSCLLFFFNIGENWIKWISFKSILISGSVNFIFSEYFCNEYANYLSISGIVAFAQLIFRAIEFFLDPLHNKCWYWLQILFSIIAIIAYFLRRCDYYKCVERFALFNSIISLCNKQEEQKIKEIIN